MLQWTSDRSCLLPVNPLGCALATTYTNGTLIIGLFDAKTQEVLWHGSGTGKLHEDQSPAERTENINNAVAKILAKFPPSS